MNESIQLALTVGLLALGASLLIGIIGYLVEKCGDGDGRKPDGNGA